MKPFLFFIFLVSLPIPAQVNNSHIIGKWYVVDVENKALITNCGSWRANDRTEENLEDEYCNTSIEFLSSNKILFRDKNNIIDEEQECQHIFGIQEFNWILEGDKIKLIHKNYEKRINISYTDSELTLNFVGIIFVLKKII